MLTRIAHHFAVGGVVDAKHHNGKLICVTESFPYEMPKHAMHVPIMREGWVRRAQLDAVVMLIEVCQLQYDVMVVSGTGLDRAPLVAAWYLHKINRVSLQEAYDELQAINSSIRDLSTRIVEMRNG
jgi:hypothetical protein